MRYWYHPESDCYYTEEDHLEPEDGHSSEVTRSEYLSGVALDAILNASENDGSVPSDDREAAAEMIEQGVFGPSEKCVDEFGDPFDEYVTAVRVARQGLRVA